MLNSKRKGGINIVVCKDYELLPETSEAMIYGVMIRDQVASINPTPNSNFIIL